MANVKDYIERGRRGGLKGPVPREKTMVERYADRHPHTVTKISEKGSARACSSEKTE